jgi:hypothetical protein
MKGKTSQIEIIQPNNQGVNTFAHYRVGTRMMALYNNGMQWDVAFGHAPDAKRYVFRT